MTVRMLTIWLCVCCLAVSSYVGPLHAGDLKEVARSVRWTKIPLRTELPPDLAVEVRFETGKGLFAEWVYGTPDSARVAIAILPDDSGATRVYLDRDRDREIETSELADFDEFFFSKLDAQQLDDDELIGHPRNVALKFLGRENTVSVATLTRPTHSISIGDDKEMLAVEQVDIDANGLYSDPRDQILIDLDGNGKFNAFLERFPMRPVMKLQGQRWFVKADRFGKRIRLDSATATGTVRLKADANSDTDKITGLVVTLTGEDGSVFTLDDLSSTSELPVGKYYPSVLFVTLQPMGDREWSFTFSRGNRPSDSQMLEVSEGVETTIDPVGQLRFDAVLGNVNPNTGQLSIQPRLFTQHGMLINSCDQDGISSWAGSQCEVKVFDKNRTLLGHTRSGFA